MANLSKVAEEAVRKIDSKLECSICLDKFKEPKLLPCFHIYCKSPCLEKLVAQGHEGKTITCPTCRNLVSLPDNGVAGLQTDFHIEHLFEIRESLEKAQKAVCEKCQKFHATGYCCECKNFVCGNCIEMHQMWKELAAHKIIGLHEVKADTTSMLASSKQIPRCEKHPTKKLKLYCDSCSELICTNCTINFHKGHNFELATDVYQKHKEEIVSSLEPVKEKQDVLKKALIAFDDRAKDIKDQRNTVEAHIEKEISQLHQFLDQRKEQLLRSLELRTESKLKELSTQKQDIEILQVQMSSCLEYVESGLQTGTESEVLGMRGPVLKRIDEITKQFDQVIIQPQTKADTKLTTDGKQKITEICREAVDKVDDAIASHSPSNAMKSDTKRSYSAKEIVHLSQNRTAIMQPKCKPVILASKHFKPDMIPNISTLQKAGSDILTKVHHPEAIQLYATSRKKSTITELKENTSLLEHIRREYASLKAPQLIMIASQIADIMACLEEHKYIHRDLALRNIMLGQNLLCIIGEFLQIGDKRFYSALTDEKFAIKWTAPEAMFRNRFTIKSDVWSFGVVLYELITHGRSPYLGMTNGQVLDALKDGYRMPKPFDCPEKLYNIMLNCWHEDPEKRPTFETLQWQLEEFFVTEEGYEKMIPIKQVHAEAGKKDS